MASDSFAQHESLLRQRSSALGLDLPNPQNTSRKVYIVQLREPAALEHHVRTAGAGARSNKLSGGIRPATTFNRNSAEIQSYTQKLGRAQDQAMAKVGGAEKLYSYRYSLNGFAAHLTEVQAAKMRHLPEVLQVWEDEIRPLVTSDSPRFLDLFAAEVGLRGAPGLDGEDIVIGVIDSGIVPDHPSLDDTRQSGPSACRSAWAEATFLGLWLCRESRNAERDLLFEPPEGWNGICQAGDEFTEENCNNKLIGARYFVDGAQASGPPPPLPATRPMRRRLAHCSAPSRVLRRGRAFPFTKPAGCGRERRVRSVIPRTLRWPSIRPWPTASTSSTTRLATRAATLRRPTILP